MINLDSTQTLGALFRDYVRGRAISNKFSVSLTVLFSETPNARGAKTFSALSHPHPPSKVVGPYYCIALWS